MASVPGPDRSSEAAAAPARDPYAEAAGLHAITFAYDPPGDLLEGFEAGTRLVDGAERIVCIAHPRMDGDAAGSCLALATILRARGKDARVIAQGPFMDELYFLPGADDCHIWEGTWPPPDIAIDWRPDLVIVCDIGSRDRVATFLKPFDDVPIINVDHHISNDGFGDAVILDFEAAATGAIIFRWAQHAGWEISKDAALHLYVAILTDTGCFTYSNTKPETLAIAARLVGMGIAPSELARELYRNKRIETLRLEGRVIERIRVAADGRVVASHLMQRDFRELGLSLMDAHDTVNVLKSVRGALVAILFVELEPGGKTKVAFRGEGYHNLSAVAERLGGGGHARASGATVAGGLEDVMKRVFELVTPLCKEPLEQRW